VKRDRFPVSHAAPRARMVIAVKKAALAATRPAKSQGKQFKGWPS
jgi:hypothetical protein